VARYFSDPAYARQVERRTTAVAQASNPTAMSAAVRDVYEQALGSGMARVP
jgi:hypothetical protein